MPSEEDPDDVPSAEDPDVVLSEEDPAVVLSEEDPDDVLSKIPVADARLYAGLCSSRSWFALGKDVYVREGLLPVLDDLLSTIVIGGVTFEIALRLDRSRLVSTLRPAPPMGVGLFAMRTLAARAPFAFYGGSLVSVSDARSAEYVSSYCVHVPATDREGAFVVDGFRGDTGYVQFMNDAWNTESAANCVIRDLFVYAKREIAPGTELTFGYGEQFFEGIAVAGSGSRSPASASTFPREPAPVSSPRPAPAPSLEERVPASTFPREPAFAASTPLEPAPAPASSGSSSSRARLARYERFLEAFLLPEPRSPSLEGSSESWMPRSPECDYPAAAAMSLHRDMDAMDIEAMLDESTVEHYVAPLCGSFPMEL